MWEAITPASHGGKSIRRIFIFALVTIVMSFLCLFTFSQPTSAIITPPTNQSQTLNNPAPADSDPDKTALETLNEEKAAEEAETKTECAIDGVGWLVCPITKALAGGMDFIYEMLSGFLVVQPASSDDDDALYRAWTYMRSFANIAFVIAFLVIIYSQITSFGVSNYGIKRLLPRLIIAAILVNVSYYICAVAIDIFNILGYSLQDLFMMMREGLIGDDVSNVVVPTWQTVTAAILGGTGAIAGLTGVAIVASGYSIAGLALLLVPALLTCLLAVVVALAMLAARQAIITVLVILAPLAFVAYLLPNTEKLFEKWKSIFITMLVLFPAFSIVFGGSQLASIAIIKNANSIAVVILGLLVQVAPLMITPLLVKFGGGVLGKIGGMVNDPAKGPIDRVSNLARDKAEINRLDRLSKNPHKYNYTRKAQQRLEFNKRAREYDKKHYSDKADSKFNDQLNNRVLKNAKLYTSEKDRIKYETQENASRTRLENERDEIRAGKKVYSFIDRKGRTQTLDISDTAPEIQNAMAMISLNGIATNIAKREQTNFVAKTLLNNDVVFEGKTAQDYAAGLKVNDHGQETALAAAVTAMRDADNKLVAERTQIIKYFNPSGQQMQDFITKENVTVVRKGNGKDEPDRSHTFDRKDSHMMDAMIEDKLKKSSYDDMMQIMEMSGSGLSEHAVTIGDSIYANGLQNKNPWLGGAMTGKITQGEIKSRAELYKGASNYFLEGRFGTEVLAGAEAQSIDVMVDEARDILINPDKYVEKTAEGKDDVDHKMGTRKKVIERAQQSLELLMMDAQTILDPNKPGGRGATKAVRQSLTRLIDTLGPVNNKSTNDNQDNTSSANNDDKEPDNDQKPNNDLGQDNNQESTEPTDQGDNQEPAEDLGIIIDKDENTKE